MADYESDFLSNAHKILNQVKTVVVGKNTTLLWVFATILAKGHILMEDIPGVGKTTMALAFSKTLGLQPSRVQFTPDVLPSDVTGYSILDQKTGELQYKPGAVLCNLFLADELNRATSRTQSALLEAMEEGQVTVDGVSHCIPRPFIVIATQNPTGAAGTQPLPDSQTDRFMVQLSMGYPGADDEVAMVTARQGRDPLKELSPVITRQELLLMQETVAATYISEEIVKYVVSLVRSTREHSKIERGASPRATLAVVAMAKSMARLRGRDFVLPKDVQEVFCLTIAHRLEWKPEVREEEIPGILVNILRSIPAPALR
ncbi:MAG: MoxR family ATPase [Oscillospiraceae bacterium]|nr:MoxR family ATPase [Oscillospiraceae bacterium]